MLSVLWDRQHAGLRRAIAVALGAALMLFLLAGCSQLSEVPSAISTGLYGRVDVPAEFTVQTDTEEGTSLMFQALGYEVRPMEDTENGVAESYCQIASVQLYGQAPNNGSFGHGIMIDPNDPFSKPIWLCVMRHAYSLEALQKDGANMKPPRVVLHYDRGLRTVRYGTQRVD